MYVLLIKITWNQNMSSEMATKWKWQNKFSEQKKKTLKKNKLIFKVKSKLNCNRKECSVHDQNNSLALIKRWQRVEWPKCARKIDENNDAINISKASDL